MVDLGSVQQIDAVSAVWSGAAPPGTRVEVSTDGATYQPYTAGATVSARYVAVAPATWQDGLGLVDLVVAPA